MTRGWLDFHPQMNLRDILKPILKKHINGAALPSRIPSPLDEAKTILQSIPSPNPHPSHTAKMSLLRTYTLAIAIAATLLTSAFALPATTTDFPLGPRTIYTLTPVLPATPRTTYTVTPISTTLTLSPLAATPTLAGPNDAAIEPRRIRSKHLKINCRLICDPWAELYSREMCQERSACAGGPDDEVCLYSFFPTSPPTHPPTTHSTFQNRKKISS